MIRVNSRIVYSVVSLVAIMAMVVTQRPSVMMRDDGRFKEFGFAKDQTMYSLSFVAIMSAILLFYFFSLMDVVRGTK